VKTQKLYPGDLVAYAVLEHNAALGRTITPQSTQPGFTALPNVNAITAKLALERWVPVFAGTPIVSSFE